MKTLLTLTLLLCLLPLPVLAAPPRPPLPVVTGQVDHIAHPPGLRHVPLHIEPVQQWRRKTAPVSIQFVGRADAIVALHAVIAARAWIHGRNQLESGRVTDLVPDPGYGD